MLPILSTPLDEYKHRVATTASKLYEMSKDDFRRKTGRKVLGAFQMAAQMKHEWWMARLEHMKEMATQGVITPRSVAQDFAIRTAPSTKYYVKPPPKPDDEPGAMDPADCQALGEAHDAEFAERSAVRESASVVVMPAFSSWGSRCRSFWSSTHSYCSCCTTSFQAFRCFVIPVDFCS